MSTMCAHCNTIKWVKDQQAPHYPQVMVRRVKSEKNKVVVSVVVRILKTFFTDMRESNDSKNGSELKSGRIYLLGQHCVMLSYGS